MTDNSTLDTLNIDIKDLLNAGVHRGHSRKKCNPYMYPYVYDVCTDGTHLIDLRQTVGLMKVAMKQLFNVVKKNGKVLFVGTAPESSSIIVEAAMRCGQHYVNHRWLGGMFTNYKTIAQSIKKLNEIEKVIESIDNSNTEYTKKELLSITRERDKLLKSLAGIRGMNRPPNIAIIFDTKKDKLAVQECTRLNIPFIGFVDTDCDPRPVPYIVPGNDDSIKSIKYYANLCADTILLAIEAGLIESGVDIKNIEGSIDGLPISAKTAKSRKAARHDQYNKVSKSVDVAEEISADFENAIN